MKAAEQQFGLTPLARMRLNVSVDEAVESLAEMRRQLADEERRNNEVVLGPDAGYLIDPNDHL